MHLLLINGPNLNLLGKREPMLYGNTTFAEYLEGLQADFVEDVIEAVQYNEETAIVDALHRAISDGLDGVVINPAAFSHTSIAIADAVAAVRAVGISVVEVHISNTFAREAFRQKSYVSKFASGVITGLGLDGYRLAILHLLQKR